MCTNAPSRHYIPFPNPLAWPAASLHHHTISFGHRPTTYSDPTHNIPYDPHLILKAPTKPPQTQIMRKMCCRPNNVDHRHQITAAQLGHTPPPQSAPAHCLFSTMNLCRRHHSKHQLHIICVHFILPPATAIPPHPDLPASYEHCFMLQCRPPGLFGSGDMAALGLNSIQEHYI
jgi:hypothetical protein